MSYIEVILSSFADEEEKDRASLRVMTCAQAPKNPDKEEPQASEAAQKKSAKGITGEVDLGKRKRNRSPVWNQGNLKMNRKNLLKRRRNQSLRRPPRQEPLHHLLKKEDPF